MLLSAALLDSARAQVLVSQQLQDSAEEYVEKLTRAKPELVNPGETIGNARVRHYNRIKAISRIFRLSDLEQETLSRKNNAISDSNFNKLIERLTLMRQIEPEADFICSTVDKGKLTSYTQLIYFRIGNTVTKRRFSDNPRITPTADKDTTTPSNIPDVAKSAPDIPTPSDPPVTASYEETITPILKEIATTFSQVEDQEAVKSIYALPIDNQFFESPPAPGKSTTSPWLFIGKRIVVQAGSHQLIALSPHTNKEGHHIGVLDNGAVVKVKELQYKLIETKLNKL